MWIGRIRYLLTKYEPVSVKNVMGEAATEYVDRGPMRAERVKASGYRREEAAEHFADYRAEFNVRSMHAIGENWRVQVAGEHLYTVVAIIPNIDKGYKTLICERVNE